MRSLRLALSLSLFTALASAQGEEVPFEEEPGIQFRVSGEVKGHYRWSEDDSFARPGFPPAFVPVGRDQVEMRTVSPGSSIEVSKATLFFDVDFPRSMFGRVKIDFIDLYDRNPTSNDRNVDVDEAYPRFGKKYESLEPIDSSHVYALLGKAPKFERQLFRRLESYGLVQTAFNRFNDLQLQFGGSVGSHVYFRAQVSNGNPTFFRDPNVLAGDNGVVPPPNPDITFDSEFRFSITPKSKRSRSTTTSKAALAPVFASSLKTRGRASTSSGSTTAPRSRTPPSSTAPSTKETSTFSTAPR